MFDIDTDNSIEKSAAFAALFIFRIAFHVASTKYPERSSGKAISFDCNIPKSAEKVDKLSIIHGSDEEKCGIISKEFYKGVIDKL